MTWVILYLWLFWALFVATMNLYRVQLTHGLTPAMRVLGAPLVLLAYVVDVLSNLVVATLVFAEPPHELLVTSRLKRYMLTPSGWRYKIAHWLCLNLLDPLDPTGKHCE